MSKTKSISKRIALLRQYREGRELSRSLRESLLVDVVLDGSDDAWVLCNSEGSGNTTVKYVMGGDAEKIRFTLKLLPCCLCRGCQTVQVCCDGAPVWLPPLARLLLRNAVRLFVLRYANAVADQTLGN